MSLPRLVTRAMLAGACALWLSGAVWGAEVKVMCSGGFSAALRALVPEFERNTNNVVLIEWGPSMGTTKDAIPVRLQRGETADVLIMVRSALDELASQGRVVTGSRTDLASSLVGIAVRKGASRPDISSVDGLRRALLDAHSIAYSDSASGVYVSTELFLKLGIADQVKAKSRMIPAEPMGAVVARGEAEIGFQQISELLPVPGIEVLGAIPAEVQKVTVFSAGVSSNAAQSTAARAFIDFLASPAAIEAIRASGLEALSRDGVK
jgi:molybdate transport system substrate-binding protein